MDFQKSNSFEEDNHIKNYNSVFSIVELPNNSFFLGIAPNIANDENDLNPLNINILTNNELALKKKSRTESFPSDVNIENFEVIEEPSSMGIKPSFSKKPKRKNILEEENENIYENSPNYFLGPFYSNILKNEEPKSGPSGVNINNFNAIEEPSSMGIIPSFSKKSKKKNILEKENEDIYENKKNIFNVFNLFNPRGAVESQELNQKLKLIRDEINQIINMKAKIGNNDKFKITNENKKKKNSKSNRKKKPDDIRKKIKSRFLKALRIVINKKLKKANSEKEFDFLPQCFVCAITRQKNDISVLNMNFKELMSTDFFTKYNLKVDINKNLLEEKTTKKLLKKKRGPTCPDRDKYKKNVEVIKYLEENKKVSEKTNFEIISKMKFSEMFAEYLKSKEFEEDIWKLKYETKEDEEYIKDYIIKAYEFIKYFSKSGKI